MSHYDCKECGYRFDMCKCKPVAVSAADIKAVQQVHNMVRHPSHYDVFPDVESITIIAASMTVDEFRGFCLGNVLKYRLRAGKKDKLQQDIDKAQFYTDLFNNHKHLCRSYSLTCETKSR